MFNDMDNLINNFFEQSDKFIKEQKEKQNNDNNSLSKSFEETTKYQKMGD